MRTRTEVNGGDADVGIIQADGVVHPVGYTQRSCFGGVTPINHLYYMRCRMLIVGCCCRDIAVHNHKEVHGYGSCRSQHLVARHSHLVSQLTVVLGYEIICRSGIGVVNQDE